MLLYANYHVVLYAGLGEKNANDTIPFLTFRSNAAPPKKFVINVMVLPSGTHFQATVGTQTAMGHRNILVLGRKLNGTFGGKHLCFRCPRAICHSCLCVSHICWPCVFNRVGLLISHNQLGFKYFDYLIYIPKQ